MELLLLPKFDNSSSFVTRDLSGDYELMTSLLPEVEYPMEPFQWCLSGLNLMFLASPWLEIFRFSNWLFCWLWAVQSWYLFCLLWASQNWPYLVLYTTLDRSLLFYWVRVRHTTKKQSKPSLLDKNSRTMHKIWHKSFSMIQSAIIKNWFP